MLEMLVNFERSPGYRGGYSSFGQENRGFKKKKNKEMEREKEREGESFQALLETKGLTAIYWD